MQEYGFTPESGLAVRVNPGQILTQLEPRARDVSILTSQLMAFQVICPAEFLITYRALYGPRRTGLGI
jgi:hypothetical protein